VFLFFSGRLKRNRENRGVCFEVTKFEKWRRVGAMREGMGSCRTWKRYIEREKMSERVGVVLIRTKSSTKASSEPKPNKDALCVRNPPPSFLFNLH